MRYFSLFLFAGLIGLASAPARAQQLQPNPSFHPFGKIALGSSSSYSVQITNTGTTDVNLLSGTVNGSSFALSDFTPPLQILAGQTASVTIAFTPLTAGYTTGSVKLLTSIPNVAVSIDMAGTGIDETKVSTWLEFNPTSFTFGDVVVGSTVRKRATLTAVNGDVTITGERSTSPEFTILYPKLPVKVAAGKSVNVVIEFAPSASGKAIEKAGFISNAGKSPTVALVTGNGVASKAHGVDLSWSDPGSADTVGYNVFRATVQTGPFAQINTALTSSTDFTDSDVVAGKKYYYVATAVDSKGNESPYSNVAEATIP